MQAQEPIQTKLQALGNEYQTLPKNSKESNILKDRAYDLLIRETKLSVGEMVYEVAKYFHQENC